MGNGWGDLRLHTRAVHGKLMWFVVYMSQSNLKIVISLYSIATFASDPRKYFPMNIYYILQELYLFTCQL